MNLLFPFSVSISTAICAVLATEAAYATSDFNQAGYTFLATMMALAILEHWFLVLPIPAEAMWNWSMKSREIPHKHEHDGRRPAGPHHSTTPVASLGSAN